MRQLTTGLDTFLVAACFFFGHGAIFFFLEGRNIPYILHAICRHVALVVLVMLVFHGEREKKLLAAVVLMAMQEKLRQEELVKARKEEREAADPVAETGVYVDVIGYCLLGTSEQ